MVGPEGDRKEDLLSPVILVEDTGPVRAVAPSTALEPSVAGYKVTLDTLLVESTPGGDRPGADDTSKVPVSDNAVIE